MIWSFFQRAPLTLSFFAIIICTYSADVGKWVTYLNRCVRLEIPPVCFASSALRWNAFDETSQEQSQIDVTYTGERSIALQCRGSARLFRDYPLVDLIVSTMRLSPAVSCEEKYRVSLESDTDSNQRCKHEIRLSRNVVEFVLCANSEVSDSVSVLETLGEESCNWLTTDAQIIGVLPRSFIHQFNLVHGGIGLLLLDRMGNVYVHKRSASKRLFPSRLDMFIGGVSQAGESAIVTLIRELKEECGIDLVTAVLESTETPQTRILRSKSLRYICPDTEITWELSSLLSYQRVKAKEMESRVIEVQEDTVLRRLGRTTVCTDYNYCIVDCFAALLSPSTASSIHFVDGEIEWGKWISNLELQRMLAGGGRKDFVPDGLQVWDALPSMIHR